MNCIENNPLILFILIQTETGESSENGHRWQLGLPGHPMADRVDGLQVD